MIIFKRPLGQLVDLTCERFGDEKASVIAGSEDEFVASALASANELRTRKAPAKIVTMVSCALSLADHRLPCRCQLGMDRIHFVTRSPPRFSRDTDVSCRFVWAMEYHKMLVGGGTQEDGGFLCCLLVVAGCVGRTGAFGLVLVAGAAETSAPSAPQEYVLGFRRLGAYRASCR